MNVNTLEQTAQALMRDTIGRMVLDNVELRARLEVLAAQHEAMVSAANAPRVAVEGDI
jgi:hypothetical protein